MAFLDIILEMCYNILCFRIDLDFLREYWRLYIT